MIEWYTRKIMKEPIEASPQYLYNNRPNQETTLLCGRTMMEILKNYGCCTEESYPYGKKDEISEDAYKEGAKYKIDGYARMRTMETLKKALVVNGPCLICFPVFNHTTQLWKQRKEEEKLGCHAMTIVGYNSKGFILRNSWGEHWDNDGYCIYPYSDWGCHDEVWTVVNESNMNRFKLRVNSVILKAFSDKTSGLSGKRPISDNGVPVPRSRRASRMSIFKSSVPDNSIQNAAFYSDNYDSKEVVSGTNEMKKKSKKGFMRKLFGKRKLPEEPVEEKEEEAVEEEVVVEEAVEEEVVEEE